MTPERPQPAGKVMPGAPAASWRQQGAEMATEGRSAHVVGGTGGVSLSCGVCPAGGGGGVGGTLGDALEHALSFPASAHSSSHAVQFLGEIPGRAHNFSGTFKN